ncbi:MAG: flavodoxin, partial [Microbacteriaceae bacterium]|nr:flavodoxin [Microbacteriaceae bacterium]
VDFDVKPGVKTDMGRGDEWPAIRERLLAADILFLCTATWMGHASSVAHRVLERLDAELSETDDESRPHLFGRVAIAGVVGNEDGAHDAVAQMFQALNDVGYTIPAQGSTYWNGEAMQKTNYIDLRQIPDAVAGTNATVAANAAHLAGLLKQAIYPSP